MAKRVRLHCGSRSISAVLYPCLANATAQLKAKVVLPTPPLLFTKMSFLERGNFIAHIIANVKLGGGGGIRTHASLAAQGVSNPSEWTTIRLLLGRTVSAVALAQAEGTGFEPVSPEGQRFSRPPG